MHKYFLVLIILSLGFHSQAQAEVFYWKDPHTNMSLTYPDRWQVRNNLRPDDVFTVYAPGENDHAACRLRVRDDNRYTIYPEKFSHNIQHIAYSENFWRSYLAEYDDVNLTKVFDDSGLGRGVASMAEADYTIAVGPKMYKKSLMFVSFHNDQVYIVECSAEKHAYAKWYPSFLSVVKSIDFSKQINEYQGGYYRDFSGEKIRILGKNRRDISVY